MRKQRYLFLAILLTPLGWFPLAAQQGAPRWDVLNKNATGAFVVALAQDLQGNIWVGTEDKGVFRYDPKPPDGKQWTQFNSKNGLADDSAYAIAVDKLGRVWVGTLNKGVSVYNGGDWKNYDVLDGPLGERIFALATCPTDGDVWLATSAGLTRYGLKNDAWSYYTRADGLPEDQANALAFDSQGNIYVGTQCHGIATAKAADDYRKWTVAAGTVQLPVTPNGTGLPSSLINALLVGRDGTVYAGTTAGLAWSKDQGKTWSYLRGRDYDDKVKGRWGGAPAGWKAAPKQVMDTLLPEDYVTCLAEDDAGLIWLGFRQQGYVALDPKTHKPAFQGGKKADGLPDDYVFTLLPTSDFRPWIGTYGGGVGRSKEAMKAAGAKAHPPSAAVAKMPSLPTPAKPPTAEQSQQMLARVKALPRTPLVASYLGDDWTTQGDWVGRYGRQACTLCAMSAPLDHDLGWDADFLIGARIGPHFRGDDSLRHWVHWLKTDNPRCLYTPVAGCRRQSEWDDHGEAYPLTHDGPDIWISVQVPKGVYRIAMYFMNKDGHDGMNRCRDYLLELHGSTADFAAALKAPVRERSRVGNFWGGVYKTWLMTGPAKYYFRLAKNGSFNTIVSAVLVDRVVGQPQPWDNSWLPFMETVKYEAPKVPPGADSASPTLAGACELWQALNDAQAVRDGSAMLPAYRRLAYRTGLAQSADPALLANWRWSIPIWTQEDRQEWKTKMAKAWGVREEINRTGIIPQR